GPPPARRAGAKNLSWVSGWLQLRKANALSSLAKPTSGRKTLATLSPPRHVSVVNALHSCTQAATAWLIGAGTGQLARVAKPIARHTGDASARIGGTLLR